ncbi:MAG: hypothetical protein JRJ78_04560 [Deltaproteobacteria bacterium]|nr:hypothetical protein [Deltaproteobacteria bacterium]
MMEKRTDFFIPLFPFLFHGLALKKATAVPGTNRGWRCFLLFFELFFYINKITDREGRRGSGFKTYEQTQRKYGIGKGLLKMGNGVG